MNRLKIKLLTSKHIGCSMEHEIKLNTCLTAN